MAAPFPGARLGGDRARVRQAAGPAAARLPCEALQRQLPPESAERLSALLDSNGPMKCADAGGGGAGAGQ